MTERATLHTDGLYSEARQKIMKRIKFSVYLIIMGLSHQS